MKILRLVFSTFVLTLLMVTAAFALSLDAAKSSGQVGEKPNGYLGVVSGGGDVQALVNDINSKRKAEYQKIAKQNGTKLAAVEALAGKKAIQKTQSGHYYMTPSGSWQRK